MLCGAEFLTEEDIETCLDTSLVFLVGNVPEKTNNTTTKKGGSHQQKTQKGKSMALC